MTSYSKIIEVLKGSLKPAVMAFGRMNPPTTGHEKLVNKVHELAAKHNAYHEVILSHSQDAEKNPLSSAQKLKHAKRFFPNTNLSVSSKEHPNFMAHAKRLSDAGHRHLIMVAGSDRVDEYKKKLEAYNGKPNAHNFERIDVVSAGERDEKASGTAGMSASKMRNHAKNNDFESFKQGIPKHVKPAHAKELFSDLRKGMGKSSINESAPMPVDRIKQELDTLNPRQRNALRKKFGRKNITHLIHHPNTGMIQVEFGNHIAHNLYVSKHGAISDHTQHYTKPNDDLNEEILTEGLYDKAAFKAVFLAGGSGSGKDFVLKNTVMGQGFVEINSDKAFEYLIDVHKLDPRMPENERLKRDIIRGRAKGMTMEKERLALIGRNGIIINATGADLEKTLSIKRDLESLGYMTMMIFVHASNEVSMARNILRGQGGGRSVPEEIRLSKWVNSVKNKQSFANAFGDMFVYFDNSIDMRKTDPDTKKAKEHELLEIYKRVAKFVSLPVHNAKAEEWRHVQKMKRNIKEWLEVGQLIETTNGERGKILSIRENSVVFTDINSKNMITADIDDILNMKEETHNMNEKTKNIIAEKVNALEGLITIDEATKAYHRGVAAWDSKNHAQWLPNDLGIACVELFIEQKKQELEKLAESQLFGTTETLNAFRSMTPGEPGYLGMNREKDVVTHVDHKVTKVLPVKVEKENESAVPKRVIGKRLPTPYNADIGGIGATAGYGRTFSMTEADLPKNEKIVEWAMRDSTKKAFFEKFGPETAQAELIKAANRFNRLGGTVKNVMEERKLNTEALGVGAKLKKGEVGLVSHDDTAQGNTVSYHAARNKKGTLRHFVDKAKAVKFAKGHKDD